ncbi:MAG TPA: ABC transporter permease [Acidimicrobiales bacterium]|nr:ABC transporter permease [Acidimicrobiales bacterium]
MRSAGGRYALRRCVLAVPALLGISLLTFALLQVGPGGRVEAFARRNSAGPVPTAEEIAGARHLLGVDRPLPIQYGRWLWHALHGDLGTSDTTLRPVTSEIGEHFPYTVRLALPAAVLALLVGIPFGVVSGMHHNRFVDRALRFGAVAGASMPSFWLGLLLIDLLAVHAHMFPAAGTEGLRSMVLPVITLAIGPAALLVRITRSSLIETLGEDYVRTASAKGLRHQLVVERHALPNCLVPLLTVLGGIVGRLLVGAVIVETIFAWPGIGQLLLDGITRQDYPVVQGVILLSGALFVLLNLVVDVTYGFVDPRIDLAARRAAAP